VLIFEARNVSKAGVLGIYAETSCSASLKSGTLSSTSTTSKGSGVSVLQRKSYGAPAAVRNNEPFFRRLVTHGPLLSRSCASASPELNPYNQWLRYCRHGKNL